MKKLISIICALIVFGIWMNIVGNPHVVETAIGIVIAVAVGFFLNRWLSQLLSKGGT
jgi:putative flippase GtrA